MPRFDYSEIRTQADGLRERIKLDVSATPGMPLQEYYDHLISGRAPEAVRTALGDLASQEAIVFKAPGNRLFLGAEVTTKR